MTRARLRATGWEQDLAIEDDAQPSAKRGEVVIEVEACGVCGRDCIDRAGRFKFIRLPVTPGHEAVGRVIAIGDGVTEWKVGDRVATMHRDFCGTCEACTAGETSVCMRAAAVLGLLVDGGYARWLAAPERAFYRMPDDVEPALAAILHCTAGTAFRGLRRAGVKAGMRVLITGANGGVGAAAVGIATRLGATVVAVTRADGDSFHKKLPGGPVDVAIDCVGAPTFNAALRSLTVGGRVVAIGNVVDARVELNLGWIITRGVSILGSSGATREDMAQVLALHAAQPLEVPVHARLPVAEADRAQRLVAAGGLHGRIVLVP
jgi:acryloyl-coenzyme A reductase